VAGRTPGKNHERRTEYGPAVVEGLRLMDGNSLNEREAFDAMSRFLWQYANRAGDELFNLLGDLHIEPDGRPTDPATWDDWLGCVRAVKQGDAPRP